MEPAGKEYATITRSALLSVVSLVLGIWLVENNMEVPGFISLLLTAVFLSRMIAAMRQEDADEDSEEVNPQTV